MSAWAITRGDVQIVLDLRLGVAGLLGLHGQDRRGVNQDLLTTDADGPGDAGVLGGASERQQRQAEQRRDSQFGKSCIHFSSFFCSGVTGEASFAITRPPPASAPTAARY